ncbi:hypothetical protein GCM10023082_20680 [Streptomyces tremellae]|uniref:Uncharacterized protein n=1 Tax=Streptomyces tremellae TaxID=1124239 RepID=A0ABP7ES31_9ACTN
MDTISKQYERQCERYVPRGDDARSGPRSAGAAAAGRGGHGRGRRRTTRHQSRYDHGNDYGGGASWES